MNKVLTRLIPRRVKKLRLLHFLYRVVMEAPARRKIAAYVKTVGAGRVLWVLNTLEGEQGHALSFTEQKSVNKHNEPIPWYSYPCIEYLSNLDFRQKRIFEYGSGNSSAFWAQRCRQIVSVEDNEEWHQIVSAKLAANQTLLLVPVREPYIAAVSHGGRPDVIIVDGSHRFACAEAAAKALAPGGMIILDNSDWHPKTAAMLRGSGLIQVDFTGFNPINYYVTTTSVFLRRDIEIVPRFERLPMPGIGAGLHVEDPE